jgi:hypothetical protein
MFTLSIISLFLAVSTVCLAQEGAVALGESVDVIDHGVFDSLWQASLDRGRLRTEAWNSDAYRTYRLGLAGASPMSYLPKARSAFWVNAYLACLIEILHLRSGHRSTAWDSLWLRRDTFLVAGQRHTLESMRAEAIRAAGTVAVMGCLPSGSSRGAPFPPAAATAATIRRLIRDQMRRICRSERYLLYDPAGNVLQLSNFFGPILKDMAAEARSVADWLLRYVAEATAAQIALHASTLRVQVHDVLETWRKARPP